MSETTGSFNFALYDAFSDRPFGGSQAAVIRDAAALDRDVRQRIARELGMPATAFVDTCGDSWIQAQFVSTVMELPMCGHGTICLLTHLFESGPFALDDATCREIELRLPQASARVEVERTDSGRFRVLLDIQPASFVEPPSDLGPLLAALGLDAADLSDAMRPETARGDFIHLVLPLRGLESMRRIRPDFGAIVSFCQAEDLETIAVFCLETEDSQHQLHVRDFCPAVGVSESAAAGTTNAALSGYLWRHGQIAANDGIARLRAEQGIELGRASSIESVLRIDAGEIARLQVGGVATRVLDGQLRL